MKRLILAAHALPVVLLFGCVSIDRADTKEFVRAKSQAEGYARLIKKHFRPRDLEYVQTELLYTKLKSEYDCILDAFKNAVYKGSNPNDESNFGSCASNARDHADDYITHVTGALTAPRLDPQTNQMRPLSETYPEVDNAVKGIQAVIEGIEAVIQFVTRYQDRTTKLRAEEISRLESFRWKNFDDI